MGLMGALPKLCVASLMAKVLLVSATSTSQVLKFPSDGTRPFKILQIADPQVRSFTHDRCLQLTNEERQYPCSAYNTTAFIDRLISAERPDLLIYTGDNIIGSLKPGETLAKVFSPAIEAGVPHAAVFGNHDEEGLWDRERMIDFIASLPGSLAERGSVDPAETDGLVGNYRLTIQSSNSSNSAANIWLFDSGDYPRAGEGVSGYGWIYSAQIDWFRRESIASEIKAGRKLPSLAFFHIPTPEFWEAAQGEVVGDQNEGIYSPEINSGLMTELLTRGDVQVVACGHDHINDFCGRWYGISLCYGGGAGYTTYGMAGWSRRARIFEVFENGTIRSFKRLDDDAYSKIDEQRLHPHQSNTQAKPASTRRHGCDLPLKPGRSDPPAFCAKIKDRRGEWSD